MNKYSLFFIITGVILICLTSCSEYSNKSKDIDILKEKNEFFTIDFPSILKKERDVKLSEIADSIVYFPIETSDNSLLGHIFNARLTEDFIFINHSGGLLRQFDKKGKFVRNIGNIGRGPKEYVHLAMFSLDEKKQLIYIQRNSRNILVYDFDGNFKESIYSKINWGNLIVHLYNDHFIQFQESVMGNEKYIFMEWNNKGDTLQYVRNYTFWTPENLGIFIKDYWGRNVFYELNNSVHFKGWYNDTIYTISKNSILRPKYFIDLKQYKLPVEARVEKSLKGTRPKNKYWLGVKESNRYIFIHYGCYYEDSRIRKPDYVYWDKEVNEGWLINEKKGKSVFINDIDNGPDFVPTFVKDSIAYCFIDPINLKNNDKRVEQFSNSQLKSMLKDIKYDDNPILMKVYLK